MANSKLQSQLSPHLLFLTGMERSDYKDCFDTPRCLVIQRCLDSMQEVESLACFADSRNLVITAY